jgi:hypothetical protein
MLTLSAIPIRTPWIDMILDGSKTWEIRSKNTKKIGRVALIRSGSGTVVATASLAEVIELTPEVILANKQKMGMGNMTVDEANDLWGSYAWVLKDVVRFKSPVLYKHPSGAVTWVTLDEETTGRVLEEEERSKESI